MRQKRSEITLKDVAKKANFSVNTVSKVLSGQGKQIRISPETSKTIKTIAKQLGYIPNQMARNLRAKRSGLIAVFVAEMVDPVCTGIARAVLGQVSESGFFPLVTVAEAGLELCLESWLRNRVEALILCGTTSDMNSVFFQDLKREELTTVIAGNYYINPPQNLADAPPVSSIRINNQIGIELALEHLKQQGRSKIAFIAGPDWQYDATRRRHAYETLVKQHHKPIIADVTSQERSWKRGYHAAELLFSSNEKFDAIVAYDDLVAIGAMRWLNEHGISIPDDVAIIGFDNLPICEYAIPSLSSIEQPVELLGRKSVELLESHLVSKGKPEHTLLTPSLVIRESTQASQPR